MQDWRPRAAGGAPDDRTPAHPRPVQQVVRPQVHDGDRRVPRLRERTCIPHVHKIGPGMYVKSDEGLVHVISSWI